MEPQQTVSSKMSNKTITNHLKWLPYKTLTFVKLYRRHVCLWNARHPQYRDQEQRTKAYAALGEPFRLSIDEVKAKIKNLRSTYLQEVKKIQHAKAMGYEHRSSLMWINEIHICFENGNGQSTPVKNEKVDTEDESEILIDTNENVTEESEAVLSMSYSDDSGNIPKETNSKEDTSLNQNQSKDSNSTQDMTNDDKFYIFGRYVACQLKQMNVYRALKLEAKIVELLTQERIKELEEMDGIGENVQELENNANITESIDGSESIPSPSEQNFI